MKTQLQCFSLLYSVFVCEIFVITQMILTLEESLQKLAQKVKTVNTANRIYLSLFIFTLLNFFHVCCSFMNYLSWCVLLIQFIKSPTARTNVEWCLGHLAGSSIDLQVFVSWFCNALHLCEPWVSLWIHDSNKLGVIAFKISLSQEYPCTKIAFCRKCSED